MHAVYVEKKKSNFCKCRFLFGGGNGAPVDICKLSNATTTAILLSAADVRTPSTPSPFPYKRSFVCVCVCVCVYVAGKGRRGIKRTTLRALKST